MGTGCEFAAFRHVNICIPEGKEKKKRTLSERSGLFLADYTYGAETKEAREYKHPPEQREESVNLLYVCFASQTCVFMTPKSRVARFYFHFRAQLYQSCRCGYISFEEGAFLCNGYAQRRILSSFYLHGCVNYKCIILSDENIHSASDLDIRKICFFIVKSKRQHMMNTKCKLKIRTFPHPGNKNMANCSYAII